MIQQIKRSDWVTCHNSAVVGLVKRMAKDGSWAVVEWPTCTKRMQTSVLEVQSTIPFGDGWTVTDVERERELTQPVPQSKMCPFCPLMGIEESLYDPIGNDFFGEPAKVGDIPSCEGCAIVINGSDSPEYVASMVAKVKQGLAE